MAYHTPGHPRSTVEVMSIRSEYPPGVLVTQLADARRDGESFEAAWPGALKSALDAERSPWEKREWRAVFTSMTATWRAAWERRPALGPEHALVGLLDDERVVPLPDRECAHCHGEIAPERKQIAIYCSDECRRAAVEKRRLAAAA